MKHNEQEIKAMVKKAYSAATPDVLESVLSDCKKLKGRVTPMKKKNYLKSIIAAAAACSCLQALSASAHIKRQTKSFQPLHWT